MIRVNGENKSIDTINLLEYLQLNGYNPAVVAVEINGVIIKKAEFYNTILKSGDSVEIVSFVGGG